MTKGRKKLAVPEAQLRSIINQLEQERSFLNRNELFQAVADSEWGQKLGISPSVIYLRIAEFNIELKTPKGKKGNPNLKGITGPREIRQSRKIPLKAIKALRSLMPDHPKLINKVASGSLTAAIKAMCLMCCCYEAKEVRLCTELGCPLWGHRKGAINLTE